MWSRVDLSGPRSGEGLLDRHGHRVAARGRSSLEQRRATGADPCLLVQGQGQPDDVPHLKARDRRQNPQQFLGLTARAQRQNGVTVRHHSEIAVQGVERIEHDCGRTGAGKGRGDFAADVSRLSHPENDNFSARINRRFQQFDCVTETFAETLPQSLQLKNFDFEDACGLFKVVHRYIIEPEDETGQDCSVFNKRR